MALYARPRHAGIIRYVDYVERHSLRWFDLTYLKTFANINLFYSYCHQTAVQICDSKIRFIFLCFVIYEVKNSLKV